MPPHAADAANDGHVLHRIWTVIVGNGESFFWFVLHIRSPFQSCGLGCGVGPGPVLFQQSDADMCKPNKDMLGRSKQYVLESLANI